MERVRSELEARGVRVIAVGPHSQAAADRMRRVRGLGYPVTGDPDGRFYTLFGFQKKLAGLLQESGTVAIARDGTVRYIHHTPNFMDELRLEEALASLGKTPVSG